MMSALDPAAAVQLVEDLAGVGADVRLFGGMAVWLQCSDLRERFRTLRPRPVRDIDIAALLRDRPIIEGFFRSMGWTLDADVAAIPGVQTSVCYLVHRGTIFGRCDVVYNQLDYCHLIDLRRRLYTDSLTIPLAELLLSKLQIAQPTPTDLFDLTALLLEHRLGPRDGDLINTVIIAQTCAASWPLYTTVAASLNILRHGVAADETLTSEQRRGLIDKIAALELAMQRQRKTLRWYVRRLFGKRLRWYEDVEPIGLDVGEVVRPL